MYQATQMLRKGVFLEPVSGKNNIMHVSQNKDSFSFVSVETHDKWRIVIQIKTNKKAGNMKLRANLGRIMKKCPIQSSNKDSAGMSVPRHSIVDTYAVNEIQKQPNIGTKKKSVHFSSKSCVEVHDVDCVANESYEILHKVWYTPNEISYIQLKTLSFVQKVRFSTNNSSNILSKNSCPYENAWDTIRGLESMADYETETQKFAYIREGRQAVLEEQNNQRTKYIKNQRIIQKKQKLKGIFYNKGEYNRPMENVATFVYDHHAIARAYCKHGNTIQSQEDANKMGLQDFKYSTSIYMEDNEVFDLMRNGSYYLVAKRREDCENTTNKICDNEREYMVQQGSRILSSIAGTRRTGGNGGGIKQSIFTSDDDRYKMLSHDLSKTITMAKAA